MDAAAAPDIAMAALEGDRLSRLVYLLALLVLVSAGVVRFYRDRLPLALSHAAIWLVIIAALVLVYAACEPLLNLAQPIVAELNPSRAILVTAPDGAGELTVRRGPDGHFRIRAEANGTLSTSLLGMNALNRFAGWRVEGDRLVLLARAGG